MSRLSPRFVLSALCALLGAALAPDSSATTYSGSLSDSSTGPIPAGVHTMNGACGIPAGQTLTIQAGAILKFTASAYLQCDGVVHVQGTLANPVTMTSIHDDTIGGDTNGNGGASAPGKGQWYGLQLRAGSTGSTFSQLETRYTGTGGYGALRVEHPSANFTATNCKFRLGAGAGIAMSGVAATPTVSGCTFDDLNDWPVNDCLITSVPGFTNNSVVNQGQKGIRVSNGTFGTAATIGAANCLGGALVVDTALIVQGGGMLTLNAGAVLKFTSSRYLTLDGTLDVNGTLANPVVLTSIHDDSIAGDTNGNGVASSPGKGQWYGVIFHTGSAASTIDRLETRYTGTGGYGAFHIEQSGANFTATNCVTRQSAGAGVDMNNQVSFPTFTQCTFDDSSGYPVEECLFDSVPGFVNNSAINGTANALRVSSATLATDPTIGPANCINGAIVLGSPLMIPAGRTLTVNAGVVMKFESSRYVTVHGTLDVDGTSTSSVTMTSIHDDSMAGDSNGNGNASAPGKGQWYGIIADVGATSALDFLEVRYVGTGGYGGIDFQAPGTTTSIHALTVRHGAGPGVRLNNQTVFPSVIGLNVVDVDGWAVDGARLDNAGGFQGVNVAGTALKAIRVSNGTVSQDATLTRLTVKDGAIYVDTNPTIPAGVRITLLDGTVMKMGASNFLTVAGALDVLGNADSPVTFTSIHDDSVAGDTNGNGGASAPGIGQWYYVEWSSATMASAATHANVRYSGTGGFPGIVGHSPGLTTRAVRVQQSSRGFRFNSGSHSDLTAWNCSNEGFHLESGNFMLRRSTAASCGVGVRAEAAFTGAVASSNFFGNTTNVIGGTASTFFFTNGTATFAGSNGNLNTNPLYRNVATGDLRLSVGSPCIDTADDTDVPLLVRDSAGFPRYLDGDLDGNPRADMGAYEFDNVELTVTGTFTPNGSMTIAIDETSNLTTLLFIGDTYLPQHVHPAGALYVSFASAWVMIGWPSGSSSFTFTIPGFLPSPQSLTIQALGYPNLGAANLSNPANLTIQ